LRVHPDCDKKYRKILKGTSFTFNHLHLSEGTSTHIEQELFNRGVFIQTIVGKNGSGKSSILEIIYRIINNYAYYILCYSKPKRVAAEPIYLIEGIDADLDFVIDNKLCSLQVRDKSLAFVTGDKKVYFGAAHKNFEGFENYNIVKPQAIVELVSKSFYTIVTNYSFQSLISKDFQDDVAKDFTNGKTIGFGSNGNWLDSLFRKNDGYMTPIVLNPYREDGKIDLNREYILTQSRMSALLIEARERKKELLADYSLNNIHYTANIEHFLYKFFPAIKEANPQDLFNSVVTSIKVKGTVANTIIKAFGLTDHNLNVSDYFPYAYLVYKTLSTAGKYPQYEDYKNIPSIKDYDKAVTKAIREDLNNVVKDILTDKSHVNTKIFQTLNYINEYREHIDKLSLNDYKPYLKQDRHKDLTAIIEHLPPPYYQQEITLCKEDKGIGDQEKEEIKLSSLSSGERQFIYTISTIVYHIKNLLSIQRQNSIRYRNINIVLDEVEICFHPEYQRRFIDWFLALIQRLNLNRNCSFNILIVTHSPFILSDIPKRNILYLENGEQIKGTDLINPFAANINDILYQSFFLEGGFMGEHAKKQINSAMEALITKIDRKTLPIRSPWSEEKLLNLIEVIGEPLLKDNMLSLYNQAFDKPSVEELLKSKDEQIRDLTEKLNNKRK
ncbi:MAG: hypothetical protein EOO43_01765, partial [Flavobacterium sp.]